MDEEDVLKAKFKDWARHRFDRAYCDCFVARNERVFDRFFNKRFVVDDFGTIERMKNSSQPVLHLSNHASQFDYVLQMYNFWKAGVEFPRIAARENVFVWPFKEVFSKFGAFKLPFEKMNTTESKAFYELLLEMVEKREGFLIYPEGGRSYSGEIKPFKSGGTGLIHKAINEKGFDYLVVPNYIGYDKPIENSFFPLLRLTKGISRAAYVGCDALAFLSRFAGSYVHRKGRAVHAFGEAFSISECSNGKDLTERARQAVIELNKKYKGMLS